MPETEAYRPGLLSSFLLGDGAGRGAAGEDGNANATRSSKKKAGSVGVSGVKEVLAGEQQQSADTSSASAPAEPSKSATNKKKKKKKDKGGGEQSPHSPGGNARGGGAGGAAAESLRPAATATAATAAGGGGAKQEPIEDAPDLASLFSTSNLKKFKRRERVDKEADAAEVWICVGTCLLRLLCFWDTGYTGSLQEQPCDY